MKVMVFAAVLLLSPLIYNAQESEKDGTLVMFWNLENFFDWTDQGTGESDREFSSMGERHWTRKKFYVKCDAISKTIMWMADRYGRMPDVAGFAEVENRRVLKMLLESTLLRKYGYEIVHFDSGDRRGIDVALIYRTAVFDKIDESIRTPEFEGEKMNTRDILTVRLRRKSDGETVNFIVNHHPSKFGGSKASEGRRRAAMTCLSELCDSLLKSPENGNVVAMGDFNDNPEGEQFALLEGILFNESGLLHQEGEGTIRYEGKWDLIDMFFTSQYISDRSEMHIERVPFLMMREKKHPGEKPFRTYSGPRYIGGVSDHCPIILWISECNF